MNEAVFYCSFANRFASGYTMNLKPESITLPDTGDHKGKRVWETVVPEREKLVRCGFTAHAWA